MPRIFGSGHAAHKSRQPPAAGNFSDRRAVHFRCGPSAQFAFVRHGRRRAFHSFVAQLSSPFYDFCRQKCPWSPHDPLRLHNIFAWLLSDAGLFDVL